MKYNFDELVNRKNTQSIKWDLEKHDKDIIPMWIADMDFKTAEPIREALSEIGDKVVRFANEEGLQAHARSVSIRTEK